MLRTSLISYFLVMQTSLEKNLFGNHPVSLPATESRGPSPAFASDPLISSLSPSVAKDAEGYSVVSSAKPSISDIVEIDGPSSANPSL